MKFFLLLVSCSLLAEPPRQIPEELFAEYTLGGVVPVFDWYLDGINRDPIRFQSAEIAVFLERVKKRESYYYGETDLYLYELLDQHASEIQGKTVAVIGSQTPWYESIVLAYGGFPYTIEYNQIECDHPLIEVTTVEEFNANPKKFDAILCISSIEHDGLGRYGDPLNPQADLETMEKLRRLLSENGLLFLAIPVGSDALYWNAHRVYGKLRLPLLFEGWNLIQSAGYSESDLSDNSCGSHQPVFLLTNRP